MVMQWIFNDFLFLCLYLAIYTFSSAVAGVHLLGLGHPKGFALSISAEA